MAETSDEPLTNRQQLAIAEILTSPSLEEAHRRIDVSKGTLFGWLKQPAFQAELGRQREALVEQVKEAVVSEKALDEVLKALDGLQIEREDRKPEAGRGGKAAYYRWRTDVTTSLSPFPTPAIETE